MRRGRMLEGTKGSIDVVSARQGISHRTMAAATAQEIRRRILEGELPEGKQLRQDALSRDLGVSRSPIREALVQLESEGLVKITPHRGAVVASFSPVEIEELFKLREILEPRLLRLSARRLTDTDYARIDKILTEFSKVFASGRIWASGELNTALHSALYQHAEQPRTFAFVKSLLQNSERYTHMQLAFTGGLARAEREHKNIVALCRRNEVDAACDLLSKHIRDAGDSLVSRIREKSSR